MLIMQDTLLLMQILGAIFLEIQIQLCCHVEKWRSDRETQHAKCFVNVATDYISKNQMQQAELP